MHHDDAVYIGHILDTARKIADRAQGISRSDFDEDDDLQDALAHRVQVIGEAASRLSVEIRERSPQIPWNRVIGMRHRIVHAYMDIDYDILWEVATKSVPELIEMIESLVGSDGER